jgi:tRNA threonylcarbamoyl adenosine modification protein YeaZ
MPLRILGIETAADPLSVALLLDEELQGLYLLGEPHVHDRMAAELVRRLLEDCHLELSQLDAVAISAGPGSFTGLRIGASLAKGLCFEAPPALVPVPTLEALAEAAAPVAQALQLRSILACIPGHLTHSEEGTHGWLFVQEFSPTASPLTPLQRRLLHELVADERTLLCGPGAPWVKQGIHIPWLERLCAEWIARAGLRRYAQGHRISADAFVPLYGMEFEPQSR